RLAYRLDDRVADEEEKDVEHHEQRRRAFAGANVGEEREGAVDSRLPCTGRDRGSGWLHAGPPESHTRQAARDPATCSGRAVERARFEQTLLRPPEALEGDRPARTQQVGYHAGRSG